MPGATFQQTSWQSQAIAEVCYQSNSTTPNFSDISFMVVDDACPFFGTSFYTVDLNSINSTYAGPDTTLCNGQSAHLNATGGSSFVWTCFSVQNRDMCENTLLQ